MAAVLLTANQSLKVDNSLSSCYLLFLKYLIRFNFRIFEKQNLMDIYKIHLIAIKQFKQILTDDYPRKNHPLYSDFNLPDEDSKMSRGDKSAYTEKQKRQAKHIEDSEKIVVVLKTKQSVLPGRL